MRKKKVILSFDYELFFGDRSGTVQKTLIEPTNQLLDAMDSVGFKGNFFVDWQMLKYLMAEGTERTDVDYALIESQLKDLIRRGHRIELHIHPHWVDAKYNGDGTWDFSEFCHYSLNTFTEDEIIEMFKEGSELLTSIARQVDPDYKLCAFRAGGWAVQPFDKIKKGLLSVGIIIDSSVMPRRAIKTENSECNFLNAPEPPNSYYYFEDDVCIDNKKGSFIEIPITSTKKYLPIKIINRLYRYSVGTDFSTLADGTHFRMNDIPDKWINPEGRIICTFSSHVPINPLIMRLLYKGDIVCFIDHPKDLSKYTCKGIKLLSKVADSLTYCELKNII